MKGITSQLGESEEESKARQGETPASAHIVSDWSRAGDFFSSILTGLVIGLAGDYFLNTEPWLVVAGIIAGFAVGFWRMMVQFDRATGQVTNPRLERIARMHGAIDAEAAGQAGYVEEDEDDS